MKKKASENFTHYFYHLSVLWSMFSEGTDSYYGEKGYSISYHDCRRELDHYKIQLKDTGGYSGKIIANWAKILDKLDSDRLESRTRIKVLENENSLLQETLRQRTSFDQ